MTRIQAVLLAIAAIAGCGVGLLLPPRTLAAKTHANLQPETGTREELGVTRTASANCGGPGGRFGGPGLKR